MQSQLVCSSCRSILLYPRGTTNVFCAVCSTITYGHGSTLLRRLQNFAYVYMGGNECEMFLLSYYEPWTESALIDEQQFFRTEEKLDRNNNNQSVLPYQLWQLQDRADNPPRTPIPPQRPASAPSPSTSAQTVVVENPMSVDENGKLVINVVVGVTTAKKS